MSHTVASGCEVLRGGAEGFQSRDCGVDCLGGGGGVACAFGGRGRIHVGTGSGVGEVTGIARSGCEMLPCRLDLKV